MPLSSTPAAPAGLQLSCCDVNGDGIVLREEIGNPLKQERVGRFDNIENLKIKVGCMPAQMAGNDVAVQPLHRLSQTISPAMHLLYRNARFVHLAKRVGNACTRNSQLLCQDFARMEVAVV